MILFPAEFAWSNITILAVFISWFCFDINELWWGFLPGLDDGPQISNGYG